MHHHHQTFIAFFALVSTFTTSGKALPQAEYRRADQNFYLRAAVIKADSSAVILHAGEYQQKGDSYFIVPHHKAPKELYVEVAKDWLEPVTPPNMPSSLGLAPDVMQIREPQGDVQTAPPDNAGAFVPATEGMPIANGAVVKTGKDGSAAVLFGGVDSVRLAPNSEAQVQQTVMPELRSTRINLKSGVVFSKVGLRPGEKQDFEVHTPFGVAFAKGTDFVCVALPDRADVWVAQGTVRFEQPDGHAVGTVKANGKGGLKIIRFPILADPQVALAAATETMTMAINFIPMANLKLKTLYDQMTQGVKITPQETEYLKLMKHVTCLLRLDLVAPPEPLAAPTPAPVPAPALEKVEAATAKLPPVAVKADVAVEPRVVATPGPLVVSPAPAALPQNDIPVAPIAKASPTEAIIDVAGDGSIHFEGVQLSSGHLERRLAAIAKKSPECTVLIRGDRKAQNGRIQTVIAMCHAAKLNILTFDDASPNVDSTPASKPIPVSSPTGTTP